MKKENGDDKHNRQDEVLDKLKASPALRQFIAEHVREKKACPKCFANLVESLQALSSDELAKLAAKGEPIYIGKGFKGEDLDGVGIGKCTKDCSRCLEGCPPKAKETAAFLRKLL